MASPHPDLSGAFFLPLAPAQMWHSTSAAVSGRLRAESSACVPDKWWLLVRGSACSWLLPLSWEACPAEQRAETPSQLPQLFFLSLLCPQEIPQELTLDALLEMDESKAKEMLRRWGASAEECSRLQQALTCLRKVTGLGKKGLLPCPGPLYLPVLPGLASSLGDGTSRFLRQLWCDY